MMSVISILSLILGVGGKFAFLCFLLWLAKELLLRSYDLDQDLATKTIIITGASRGIGHEVAIKLLNKGAKVIIGCRSNAIEVKERFKAIVPKARVESHKLDLADEKSVLEFVKIIKEKEGKKIDVLILNAATLIKNKGQVGRQITKQGMEYIMGVNYFGHVLLTEKLLESIRIDRVVAVTCPFQLLTTLNPLNPRLNSSQDSYDQLRQYALSKLAIHLYSKKLENRQRGILAITASPGLCRTAAAQHFEVGLVRVLCQLATRVVGKSPSHAANSIVFAAVAKMEGKKNVYVSNCRFHQDPMHWQTNDQEVVEVLWNETAELIGINRKLKN